MFIKTKCRQKILCKCALLLGECDCFWKHTCTQCYLHETVIDISHKTQSICETVSRIIYYSRHISLHFGLLI